MSRLKSWKIPRMALKTTKHFPVHEWLFGEIDSVMNVLPDAEFGIVIRVRISVNDIRYIELYGNWSNYNEEFRFSKKWKTFLVAENNYKLIRERALKNVSDFYLGL